MASISQNAKYYRIIFQSKYRQPNRKEILFSKSHFARKRNNSVPSELKEIKNELEKLYANQEFDPWQDPIPSINGISNKPSLGSQLEIFINHKSQDWNKKTKYSNEGLLRRFVDHIGADFLINQLQENHINEYLDNNSWSYDTKKSYRRVLKQFAQFIGLNKERIRIIKRSNHISEKNIAYYTQEDRDNIKNVIIEYVDEMKERGYQDDNKNDLWLLDFIDWQFYSGMRISETISINIDNIDWNNKALSFYQKGDKSGARQRKIYLDSVPILFNIAEKRLSKSKKLFPYTAQYTSHRHLKFRRMAIPEREELDVHAYRHSCAITLLENGADIRMVGQWLGHSDLKATQIYAKYMNKKLSSSIGNYFSKR